MAGRGGGGVLVQAGLQKQNPRLTLRAKRFPLLSSYIVVSKNELHRTGPSVPNEKGSENLGWASDFTQALPHSARSASDEL